MTYDQFVRKLEKVGIAYTLFRFDTAIYVEVGRYGYRFVNGLSSGGWNTDCGEDWRAEWEKWFELLRVPTS